MNENVRITDPVWMVDPNWMQKTGGYARDMTLREWYAGLAMQALLAYKESTLQNAAEVAYQMADAMLKARDAK
jgi:hypothetical protein